MTERQISLWREPGDKQGKFHLKIVGAGGVLCGLDLTFLWPYHVEPLTHYKPDARDCAQCVEALEATRPTP